MKLATIALVACALTACSSRAVPRDKGDPTIGPSTNVAPEPDFTSGSRLRAEVYVGDDAKILRGWFDTSLDVECTFRLAEDGVVRCLPIGGTLTYSDSNCSMPYNINGPYRSTAPVYGTTTDPCAPAVIYLGTGEPTALQQDWVRNTSGECMLSPGDWEYTTIAHVDAHTFVAATITTTAVDGALGIQTLAAEDGARAKLFGHDMMHDDDCDLLYGATPTICAPRASTTFASYTCAGAIVTCASGAPSTIAMTGTDCNVTAATAVPSTCAVPAGHVALAAGSSFDAPLLGEVVIGESRIRLQWVTSAASGTPLHVASFYDTKLGESCSAVRTRDGVLRCVPPASQWPGYFADAACSIPIGVESCATPPLVAAEHHYFARGSDLAPNTPAYVYGYLCGETVAPPGAFTTTPLPDDAFAELIESTE